MLFQGLVSRSRGEGRDPPSLVDIFALHASPQLQRLMRVLSSTASHIFLSDAKLRVWAGNMGERMGGSIEPSLMERGEEEEEEEEVIGGGWPLNYRK